MSTRPHPPKPPTNADCTRCGACCCNSDTNRAERFYDYVEVLPGDPLRRRHDLLGRIAVRNVAKQIHLKLTPEGQCIALAGTVGQSVHCSIYDLRPQVCRRVQAGSEECLNARRERGVDA